MPYCIKIKSEINGWKKIHSNSVSEFYFSGYMDDMNISDFFNVLLDNTSKNYALLLKNITGCFSFVFVSNGDVVTYVDHISSIPLFYSFEKKIFTVSNYPPLLLHTNKCKNIDSFAKKEMEMSGYISSDNTIYKYIKKVLPSQLIIYSHEKIIKTILYSYTPRYKKYTSNTDFYIKKLESVVKRVFDRLVDSAHGRQIVVPLSAGKDSRFILSNLIARGYKNIICFTYGYKGTFEIKTAKLISKQLNCKWFPIYHSLSKTKKFTNSLAFSHFFTYSNNMYSMPHLQELMSIYELKEKKIIDKDAIIVNGNTGDFITGAHTYKSKSDSESYDHYNKRIEAKFIEKHYTLWKHKKLPIENNYCQEIFNRVKKDHGYDESYYKNSMPLLYDFLEYYTRQANHIVTSQRVYEFYGYDWRMPFWDLDFVNFWKDVPLEHKIDQSLFKIFLLKREYCTAFHIKIPVNNFNVRPLYVKIIRLFFKYTYGGMCGKYKWRIFEKNFIKYFENDWFPLPLVSSYKDTIKRKGFHGWHSFVSLFYIRRLFKIYGCKTKIQK